MLQTLSLKKRKRHQLERYDFLDAAEGRLGLLLQRFLKDQQILLEKQKDELESWIKREKKRAGLQKVVSLVNDRETSKESDRRNKRVTSSGQHGASAVLGGQLEGPTDDEGNKDEAEDTSAVRLEDNPLIATTAYLLFSKEWLDTQASTSSGSSSNKKVKKHTRSIALAWAKLSQEEKAIYVEQARNAEF